MNVAVFEAKDTNDPMTIVRGAMNHAVEYGFDTVMIDTAGRLHIDDELMVELERASRPRPSPSRCSLSPMR